MKKYIYTLFFLAGITVASFGQIAPEDVDYGIFVPGTYDETNPPPPGATLEVAIRANNPFPQFPAAGALNFAIYCQASLLNGSEGYTVSESHVTGGAMIPDVGSIFTYMGQTYIPFIYNGSGIEMNPFTEDMWKHVFTINISNLLPGTTAQSFHVADANAQLYIDLGFRSNLSILGFNEFVPVSIAGVLPLDLIAFNAQKFQERSAKLDWVTVNEINTSNFVVQRSFDKKHWNAIGSVKAAGMSINVENYSFTDVNVYNGIDSRLNVYYRLSMVDLDGRTRLSPIQSVVFGSEGSKGREFVIYPNPASEGLQVEWDSQRDVQPTSLEFFDIQGKLVYSQVVSDNTNQEYIDFSKSTIQPGLYLLRILNGSEPLDYKQVVVGQR